MLDRKRKNAKYMIGRNSFLKKLFFNLILLFVTIEAYFLILILMQNDYTDNLNDIANTIQQACGLALGTHAVNIMQR
jgi:hypothetical protein